MIGFDDATVAGYVSYAMHAEKYALKKKQRGQGGNEIFLGESVDVCYSYGGSGSRGRGRVRGRGRGRDDEVCHYCRKPGHYAKDCRMKKGDEERRQPEQRSER